MGSELSFDQPTSYRIQVKGRLDLIWEDWFDGFEIMYTNGDTLLTGIVPDQAALYGFLSKINDLGLSLISVSRLPQEEFGDQS